MFNFLILLLALGVCFGINFFVKRPMVNPGRAAAITLTILMLVEMAAVLLMPSGSSANGRAYQLGRALGSAFLPLIIALYISQKFKERHTFRASAPDIATPEGPR